MQHENQGQKTIIKLQSELLACKTEQMENLCRGESENTKSICIIQEFFKDVVQDEHCNKNTMIL